MLLTVVICFSLNKKGEMMLMFVIFEFFFIFFHGFALNFWSWHFVDEAWLIDEAYNFCSCWIF